MADILIVDDELSMREFLQIMLEKEGHHVITAENGDQGLQIIADHSFDLVISDIKMPGISGLDLLSAIKDQDNTLPCIMITAFASPEDAITAMKFGAFDYITKPFKVDEIRAIINSALKNKRQVTGPDLSISDMAGIIGKSTPMQHIFDQIRRIAPTHANILIYGESGTGKELVAKAIHQHSKASGNNFVPVVCNAIPETLFESELFGHAKGSFTGATANKKGLLELADNGTVFLDEIGELPLTIQTKLLRFLQEREFNRVGDTRTIKVNVRVISATNLDLEEEIHGWRFREDLFYRLAVVPLRLPPLRERKDDIPLLADHFMKKYAAEFHKEAPTLSSYALKVLMDYDFPGNVRELENIIERGVALATSNILLPESLALTTSQPKNRQNLTDAIVAATSEDDLFEKGLEQIMSGLEKQLIKRALARTGNSKMKAADLLKISFRSLRYKIKKYEIT